MYNVSRHSSRPYFSFKAKRKIWKKEKALRPTKYFSLPDTSAHWNAKDALRLVAFPGVRNWRLAGHFVRAFPPEESPVEQCIFRNGISYGGGWVCVWNYREMVPWERSRITPGRPCTSWLFAALRVFGSFLLARKEMNRKYVISNIITFSKYFVDV